MVMVVQPSLSVRELATFLIDHEISGAPVESSSGDLIGVVTVTDIANSLSLGGKTFSERRQQDDFTHGWEESLSIEDLGNLHVEDADLTVGDIMSSTVMTAEASDSVARLAEIMLEAHLHRVLITENGSVVGIVTSSDLLGLLVKESAG
jgi:CBS domain-containing protein